jgi:mannose-6-phosphate isomerase
MVIERAYFQPVHKPWGSTDLRPWGEHLRDGDPVGELWCQRSSADAPEPSLQVKMLFTKERLSIQVHPDDAYARSIGLSHGKTEAWYILAAVPGSQVALGLQREVTAEQLRSAIGDGSISDLVQWRDASDGDVVLIPAGTIHAIGAGYVLVEIQQKSDATFRIFDFGRNRELHVDDAMAVATRGPAIVQPAAHRLTGERELLVVDEHFVLERLDLPPRSGWSLDAPGETWLFVVRGNARIGEFDVAQAGVIYADGQPVDIEADDSGLSVLVAYPGPEVRAGLLSRLEWFSAPPAGRDALRLRALKASARLAPASTETVQ